MDKLDIGMLDAQERWAFVVSSEWRATLQTLAGMSLVSSVVVVGTMGWIFWRHRRYLDRLSLRVSGVVAIADLLGALAQILMLNNDLMIGQTADGLRFILWLSMFSSLLSAFLIMSMAMQLHLSTLTKVRVRVYTGMEKFYIPGSVLLAVLLPSIAVGMMQGMYWIPWLHSFNWPVAAWKKRLVLWACNYIWLTLAIIYAAIVAFLLALRIRAMWRNSAEIVAEPRLPEKWSWAHLAESTRPSQDVESPLTKSDESTFSGGGALAHSSVCTAKTGRGYLLTLMESDSLTGRPMAIRTYIDKQRFLRSVQRLACYPLVPLLTQLGVVAMNMPAEPSRGLYIYGTAMAATAGMFNLAVFLLNPALPDIWTDAVRRRDPMVYA
ncbi:hypothetical protein GGF46_003237 [Coemansia sp. RSA 552]|nr:hypothetical protein GGF46_003237 [Coemansia sp. RSA 552]